MTCRCSPVSMLLETTLPRTSFRLPSLLAAAATTVALVAAGAVVAPGAASAAFASNSDFAISVANTQTMQSGCRDFPFKFSVAVLPEQSWSLDVEATNLRTDTLADNTFAFGDGPQGPTDESVFLCGFVDGPGTYSYVATLTVDPLFDDTFENELDPGGESQLVTYSNIAVATATEITTSHKKFAQKKATKKKPHTYRVRGVVGYYGGPFTDGPRKSVQVQVKKAGKKRFVTVKKVSISESKGFFTTKVKIKKKSRVRAVYTPNEITYGSTSKSKLLR